VGAAHAAPTHPTPEKNQRIVSLAPSVTEILFALGAGEQVVGVSDYCTGPPQALKLPHVGGFFVNPNGERIVALHPTLLLTAGAGDRLARLAVVERIPFHALSMDSLAEVRTAIKAVGRLLHREAAADRLAGRLDARLAALRRRYATSPPIPTLLSLSRPPGRLTGLMTCNRTSFLSELLAIAGGRNCFADAPYRYLTPGLERIVTVAPEVILELAPDTRTWTGRAHGRPVRPADRHRLIADWDRFTTLPAVRDHRIHVLTHPDLLVPSIHLPEIAEAMAAALHPEAAP